MLAVAYAIDVEGQTKVQLCDVQILVQNIQNTRTASENETCHPAYDINEKGGERVEADRNRARPKKKEKK